MSGADIIIALGVATFAGLSALWAYVSYTKRFLCPLMADSLLNGAVLFGSIAILLFADSLNMVTPENRASINIIFAVVAFVVQVQIMLVHQLYHQMVGPQEPQ